MFTSTSTSESSPVQEIEFFKSNSTWSLLKFLQYRQTQGRFLNNKQEEHRLYKKSLEILSFQEGYAEKAKNCLDTLISEKTSLAVDEFWRMIDKKRHHDEIELEELEYTKHALKDTNNETHRIRAITTNKTIGRLRDGSGDQAKGSGSQDLEELTQYALAQETLNEGVTLTTSHKRENKTEERFLCKKAKNNVSSAPQPKNKKSFSEPSLSSDENNKEHEEDDLEIKFDLTRISIELEREPLVKWEIGHINVTDRFRQYQREIIKKAEINGLTYDNIYELLALSSILILSWPCPYPTLFTIQEWKEVTKNNPYPVKDSPISQDILLSIHEASFKHFLGKDTYMEGGNSKLSRLVSRSFNDLYDSVMNIAPLKLSEDEHCLRFVHPIAHPFFLGEKEYDLVLNRSNSGSKKRPDLSCEVNGVAILNSEFKPLGSTPLQRTKDRLKVQLKARKSINQQLQRKGGPGEAVIFLNMAELMESYSMDLKYDGLYRSWPFLTTRLIIDKTMIPLAGPAIHHLVALEEHVERIAKDFKYRKCRSGDTTPPEQISYIRELPDSPQAKKLIKSKKLINDD